MDPNNKYIIKIIIKSISTTTNHHSFLQGKAEAFLQIKTFLSLFICPIYLTSQHSMWYNVRVKIF